MEIDKKRYNWHKFSAIKRKDKNGNNILFNLSFEEWYDIWIESGHYYERGRKKGQYCMARYNDTGNYEIGNVYITSIENNLSNGNKGKTKDNSGIKNPNYGKRGMLSKLAKKIFTPDGIFGSIKDGAKHYNISTPAMRYRLLRMEGYGYAAS